MYPYDSNLDPLDFEKYQKLYQLARAQPAPQPVPQSAAPVAVDPGDGGPPPTTEAPSGGGYSPSVFNRDTILAALLDAGLNRGRGIGQIIGATANNIAREQEQKKQHEYAMELAQIRSQGDPAMQAYRMAALEARKQAELGRTERFTEREKRILGMNDPNAELGQNVIEMSKQKAQAGATGRADVAHIEKPFQVGMSHDKAAAAARGQQEVMIAGAPQVTQVEAERARQKSSAQTEAKIAAELANEPQTTAAAAHKAGEVKQAQAAVETPTQRLDRERKESLTSPVPGTKVFDPAAWTASMSTPGNRQNVNKIVAAYANANEALSEMIDLRKQHGVQILGPVKKRYEAARLRAIGSYTELGHSGVLNANEWQRYSQAIPSIGLHGEDIVGSVTGQGDMTLKGLESIRDGTRAAIQSSLQPYGAVYDFGYVAPEPGQTTAAPIPAPQPAAPRDALEELVNPRAATPQQAARQQQYLPPGQDPEALPTTDERRGKVKKVNEYLQAVGGLGFGIRGSQ